MKKRRAVCKGNNASSVKRKMPDADPGEQRKEPVVVGIKPEETENHSGQQGGDLRPYIDGKRFVPCQLRARAASTLWR